MSEGLEKLRPDRDLQCYFFRPSAIAALSGVGPAAYTVSGTWRQQFDWAVIEWNRDSVFEHPALRYLPDGDLSGLTLTYREKRTNCIPVDSGLFPTVDWPYLRIWADDANGVEQIYRVRLFDHATAVEGSYVAAEAVFELGGTLTAGDVVELSWLNEHYFHTIESGDTIAAVLDDLALNINTFSETVSAAAGGAQGKITLTKQQAGEEGNRLGIVAAVSGEQTEVWTPGSQTMSGGESPSRWEISLDFGALTDTGGAAVPTGRVRKMRWTYAAALQPGAFARGEFAVEITDWSVTGTGRAYKVAGAASRRVEDDGGPAYTGSWTRSEGNFSGGTIHQTNEVGAKVEVAYEMASAHRLFLGTRRTFEAGTIAVSVDGGAAQSFDLYVPSEDFLARLDLGALGAGSHAVTAELTGANAASANNSFYFDFIEAAVESASVEAFPASAKETLATDWDTDHSLALAPERVAWNLDMLGFRGRANHYAGAILFYELSNVGNAYASGTVTFEGTPEFSLNVEVVIDGTVYSRLTLSTDTNETIAKAFEFLINDGSTGVWAESSGNVLTIHARALGTAGNAITLSASPETGDFRAVASGSTLSGGADGEWFTDTQALPRLNRAARDWHRAYFQALALRGIDGAAAFSTELSHADPSAAAGLAQRYPDGAAVLVNTPAVQTNFSPESRGFWKQVYLEMADLQAAGGMTPYLQFGEIQWWYFPNSAGMTFYDSYSTAEFESRYGHSMHVFTSNDESPDPYPDEKEFLPALIGEHTAEIRGFVRQTHAAARLEVLWPHDVNDFALTRVVNFASADWTPANLEVLKTENFTYTGDKKLNKAADSIRFPLDQGFARSESAHLVGVMRASEPWDWERRLSLAEDLESVALWAFDQFSMIGYRLPLRPGHTRSRFFL